MDLFDNDLLLDDEFVKDTFIKMKCIICGYEENMPAWCFNEVADMMLLDGNNDVPHIVCARCNNESLYPFDYKKQN